MGYGLWGFGLCESLDPPPPLPGGAYKPPCMTNMRCMLCGAIDRGGARGIDRGGARRTVERCRRPPPPSGGKGARTRCWSARRRRWGVRLATGLFRTVCFNNGI
eukprot:gene16807-biopygen6788